MVTIAQALQQAASHFVSVSASSQLDAQLLLAKVLTVDRSYFIAWPNKRLSEEQYVAFQCYVKRRAQGEPVAYIMGEKEFWGLPLTVTSDTLIPRPDTELLVELTLNKLPSDKTNKAMVLDAGTGSGAIALALAYERPQWQLWGLDNSTGALSIAEKNRQRLSLDNVRFIQSDWFSALEQQPHYDAIVSNPPYIAASDPHLKALAHEPLSALVAENKGLLSLFELIESAHHYLKSGGWLLLEHGYDQKQAIQTHLEKQTHYSAIATHNDLGANPRVTVAMKQNG
ncbi:MAG: peptide chain release factor N(5)-glutamine methyltransferase [Gammaproteobacteria bacterium]